MALDVNTKQAIPPSFAKYADTRHMTDKFFILLLPLNLLICLAIGVNVLLDEKVFLNIWRDLIWYFTEFIVYGLITTFVIILFEVILNMLKKIVFVITFPIVITILLIGVIILCILSSIHAHEYQIHWFHITFAAISIASLVYNVTIFICTREFGVEFLEPMIKKQIRAIIQSYPVVLFSLAIIFLVTIIFIITFPAAICAASVYIKTKTNNENLLFIRLSFFTFVVGGTFILDFIYNFGFIVMGDYFSNYYNKRNASKTYIFQSIAAVSRHHLGTVTLLSTPILPRFYALVMAFKNNQQASEKFKYKLINLISKMALTMNMPEYALIQTSIFGSNSFKSIRHVVDLRQKNSLLFLTLNAVSIKIMDFIMTIAIMVVWMIVDKFGMLRCNINALLFTSSGNYSTDIEMFTIFYMIWFYVNTITILIFRPAACAFTVCKMIDGQPELEKPGE